jgi:SAM-dependent methyltransferase
VQQEARFLADSLAVAPGASLLDVPCGAGRQARALGRRGYHVLGIDISEHMLAAAANEGEVPGVALRQGEMDSIDERDAYDGIYCWGNSFGYLPHERNRAFLKVAAAALKPGARLLLDAAAVAENILRSFHPQTRMEIDGIEFTADRRYLMAESAMQITYRIARGGEAEQFVARQIVYTAAEILRMAADAGLEPISLHGGIAGEEAAPGSPLIALFRRR